MHIDLNDQDAATLRNVLQERVTQLDKQINAADSLRFKDELRNEERCLERILGALSSEAATAAGPSEIPPRDYVADEDRR
jgi:hypothetical protein